MVIIMNIQEEFEKLTKPLIEFIYKYLDPDYDIVTINGYDAFINQVNDNMIIDMNSIGFFASKINLDDKNKALKMKK